MIDRTVRAAATAALALFAVLGAAVSQWPPVVTVLLMTVVIGAGVLVTWRGSSGPALVAVLALAGLAQFVQCHGEPSNLGWFGICVVTGWIATESSLRTAVLGCGVAVAGLVGEWLLLTSEPGWGAWIAGTVFTTVACVAARRQRTLLEQLREAQAGLAERSRAEERNRIAGEMHDVIGHALTVSVLHVSSARLSLDEEDPQAARDSLQEAERLARESLEEVRAAVGLMRERDGADVRPLPGAADLGDLLDTFRRTGAEVVLDVEGDLSGVGPTRGLVLYRIVQESLTNAVRHGDGSTVRVGLRVAEQDTAVRIDSGTAGGRVPRTGTGAGAGIDGMRERAEAVGGRLQAGPDRSGWRVEAVLPA